MLYTETNIRPHDKFVRIVVAYNGHDFYIYCRDEGQVTAVFGMDGMLYARLQAGKESSLLDIVGHSPRVLCFPPEWEEHYTNQNNWPDETYMDAIKAENLKIKL